MTRRCCACKRELPLDAFITITERKRRGSKVYEYTKPSYDCRDCRKEQKRDLRRRKAEEAGRVFVSRGDRAAYEEGVRAARRQRKREAQARRQQALAATQARREAEEQTCKSCGQTKGRDEFHPSMLREGDRCCKTCVSVVDADKFRRGREDLSDNYVRRQLAKKTGLRHHDIPHVLVETERVRLKIVRIVGPWKQPVRKATER